MLSANNHVISASHESEKYKKFVWDYEGKKIILKMEESTFRGAQCVEIIVSLWKQRCDLSLKAFGCNTSRIRNIK